MNFEFASPTRILFGEKRLREAGELVASMGSRALVVEGGSGRAAPLVELLRARGVGTTALRVSGEPTTAVVEGGVERARAEQCDVVVALGGGSVNEAGKAVAPLLTNTETLRKNQ